MGADDRHRSAARRGRVRRSRPGASRRRPRRRCACFVDATSESVVGANQLANVRWSAVFDGVELTAADIARLAKEARPLISLRRRWVAIDKADLTAAAEALAERAETKELSGAAMLRLALGIEGSPLAGGVDVVGGGWAADLLAAAADVASAPAGVPEGSSASCGVTSRKRWRGSASSTRPASEDASHSTWVSARRRRCWRTCSRARIRSGVGRRAARGRRQLDGRSRAIHTGVASGRAPRRPPRRRRRDRRRDRRGRRRRHHLRHRGSRCRSARRSVNGTRVVLDEAQAIKNPANDTSQQLRRIPARGARRAHRNADRERPR